MISNFDIIERCAQLDIMGKRKMPMPPVCKLEMSLLRVFGFE